MDLILWELISSISANNKKASIFNDGNTLNILSEGIYQNIFAIQFLYMLFLKEKYDVDFQLDDIKQADIILNNIQDRQLNFETEINLLLQIINLNPHNAQVYEYIVDKLTYNNENSKESLMQAKQEIASTNFNSDIYKEFLERRKLKCIKKIL